MLKIKIIGADTDIQGNKFNEIVEGIPKKSWKPAIWEAEKTLYKIAGIAGQVPKSLIQREGHQMERRYGFWGGEIFFKGEDMYFLLSSASRGTRFIRETSPPKLIRIATNKIEIGIVTNNQALIDRRLNSFKTAVESALLKVLKPKTKKEALFEWAEVKESTVTIERKLERAGEETNIKFEKATISKSEQKAANILKAKKARLTLISIAKAGYVREKDLIRPNSKDEDENKVNLKTLKHGGLLNTEFLLECRKTSEPITRLKRKELLKKEAGNLICPSCGKLFKDEITSEVYSLSELGLKMITKSYWMTVFVTGVLMKLGIPQSSILWNLEENSEEVDIITEFSSNICIFELKDREFGAGDAYPLSYRKVRYNADRAIIVASDGISPDAKKVFEETDKVPRRRAANLPLYIEKLDDAESKLEKAVSEAKINSIGAKLEPLEDLYGYDLRAIIELKFC